jgi:hypothetical protein
LTSEQKAAKSFEMEGTAEKDRGTRFQLAHINMVGKTGFLQIYIPYKMLLLDASH